MATATVPSSASQSGRTLALALFWGSGLLIVFSLWLTKNHPDVSTGVSGLLLLLVVAGVLAGVWQLQGVRQSGAAGSDNLVRQRRLIGSLLVAVGGILGALAAYLGFSLKLAGFGESLGLGLFAVFTLLGGLGCLQPDNEQPGASILERLLPSTSLLGAGLLVIGLVGMVLFFWLGFVRKVDGGSYWPQLTFLLFEGLLCLASGMYLNLARPEERTVFALRVFLLVLGGLTGLFATLLAAFMAIVNKQDVFGGIGAWQGPHGWKVWLCAYVGIVGLVLMFGSVLLARGEARAHPVLRQVLYGYNAVVTGLLLLGFLVVFNIVCYTLYPMTFEWNQLGGLISLSQKSKNLIGSLKEPVTVYMLLPTNNPAYKDTEALLNNALTLGDKLHVVKISPDQDFQAYEMLALHFKEILPTGRGRLDPSSGRGLLVVYGYTPADVDKEKDITKKIPHAFIPDRKMIEATGGGPDEPKRVLYKGEVELMRELDFLTQGQKQQKIYFLQGNGELDIANTDPRPRFSLLEDFSRLGCGALVDRLKKDNYQVQGLNLGFVAKDAKKDNLVVPEAKGPDNRKDVPEDATVVVVLGPVKELPKDVMDALERYMERGGKLVVSVDIVLDNAATKFRTSGIESLLKKYGAQVGNEYVLSNAQDPRKVLLTPPEENATDLAKQFAGIDFVSHTVRVVRGDPKAAKFKGSVLLAAAPSDRMDVLEDSSLEGIKNPRGLINDYRQQRLLSNKLAREPVPVAVTVTEDDKKPRMVVFGDTDFLANLGILDDVGERNYALFVGCLEWMAERRGVGGLRPKETSVYTLSGRIDLHRLVTLPGWLMFLGVVGLGTGIWFTRRR